MEPVEVPEVLPEDGVVYPQILRNRGYIWWRSLAGVGLALSFFLLVQTLVSQIVVALSWTVAGGGLSYASYYTSALRFERPSGMLAANLGIATAIPIAWVLMGFIHRVKPRWLSSVQPRVRWRYLLLCLVIGVLALNGMVLLSNLVEPLPAFQLQQGFWGFLVVIVLTSPLQAAAEEVLFRGYLMQALGSLVAQPWFGVVVSSLVFALLHGTQNLPLFLDRLAFGLLAAILVWRTGGIEAGVAAHIVNNIFAYVMAGLTTSVASLRAVQQITWVDAAFDVAGFALFALLAYALARRLKLRTRVELSSQH
ncbi:MAG TPA: type II CAAX endopeptidase family protein [Propionibacteriaceae bacterium]|nr:type II CAAX endopeptidase family protein [Propionibacteriaceae bacterium]